MAITDYYGNKPGTTYLEMYAESNSGTGKIIHRQLKDQEAYDAWHLQYYFKELLNDRELFRRESLTFSEIPRKEKNIFLYLLLLTTPHAVDIAELGSSLFEMIDGLYVAQKYFLSARPDLPALDLGRLRFHGIELSELLARASKELHPSAAITTYPHVNAYQGKPDILYDRSVSNYAFENSAEVAEYFNRAQVTFANIYVSKNETFSVERVGKQMVYFSLKELLGLLNKPLFHLFGEKVPGPLSGQELSKGRPVVEGFFLCAEHEGAQRMMSLAKSTPDLAHYFQEKGIALREAQVLLS
jgi:hypothetical protein